MSYKVSAQSKAHDAGKITVRNSEFDFGVHKESTDPSPAELLISAFAACCLKNVERFSDFMHYTYQSASIQVEAERTEKPPMMSNIHFKLTIHTNSPINTALLLRNMEKFGTIYNTLKQVCRIDGTIELIPENY